LILKNPIDLHLIKGVFGNVGKIEKKASMLTRLWLISGRNNV